MSLCEYLCVLWGEGRGEVGVKCARERRIGPSWVQYSFQHYHPTPHHKHAYKVTFSTARPKGSGLSQTTAHNHPKPFSTLKILILTHRYPCAWEASWHNPLAKTWRDLRNDNPGFCCWDLRNPLRAARAAR